MLNQKSPGVLHFGGARMALLDIESGYWSIRRQMEALIGPHLTDAVLQQAGANGGASFASSFFSEKVDERSTGFRTCLQAYQAAGFGHYEIETLDWPLGRVVIRAHDTFEAWMTNRHGQKSNEPVCAYTSGVLVGFINVISDRRDVVSIERACQAQGAEACVFELLPSAVVRDASVVPFSPDPALGRQLNLLEMLFDRMPMGIAVLDRDFRIWRFNPTWYEYSQRYAPPSSAALVPGVNYFDHLPGSQSSVMPLFERVLAGETIQQDAVRLEVEGSVSYWDVVLAPLLEEGQVTGILNVAVDATGRVLAHQALEQRVDERTRELQTLLEVSAAADSSLDLDEMLATTLDRLVALVGASRAGVILRDDNSGKLEARMLRPERIIPPEELSKMFSACEAVMVSGEALYIAANAEQDFTEPGALLPLRIRGQALGVLVIIGPQWGRFSQNQIALFISIADQLSVSLENARLYKNVEQVAVAQERNRLARDLHDAVTQTLFSATLIAEVLPKLMRRDPEIGLQKLEELRLLTRGALSEMRTLLFELRPDTLGEVDLAELYGHLTNAFTGRTRVPVASTLDIRAELPPAVKEVFFRVAQEALNNIAKHSGASQVSLHLVGQEDRAEVIIQDDGCGFDIAALSPKNLGLEIMRERAEAIHGDLDIQATPGAGTRVRLRWQGRKASHS